MAVAITEKIKVYFIVNLTFAEPLKALRSKMPKTLESFHDVSVFGGTTNWYVSAGTDVIWFKQRARIRKEIVDRLMPIVEKSTDIHVESAMFTKLTLPQDYHLRTK